MNNDDLIQGGQSRTSADLRWSALVFIACALGMVLLAAGCCCTERAAGDKLKKSLNGM